MAMGLCSEKRKRAIYHYYRQISDSSSPLIPLSLSSGQIALRNLLKMPIIQLWKNLEANKQPRLSAYD